MGENEIMGIWWHYLVSGVWNTAWILCDHDQLHLRRFQRERL
jgi:hypothetical protein